MYTSPKVLGNAAFGAAGPYAIPNVKVDAYADVVDRLSLWSEYRSLQKLRLRTGDTLMPDNRSLGSQVSSEPVSTSTSTGAAIRLSSLGLRAVTLTLNMLIDERLPHSPVLASR